MGGKIMKINVYGNNEFLSVIDTANLRGADLQHADLRGADLDYACWPLWCGSLTITIDNKIANQLLYHVISVIGTNKFTPDQIADANKFHHVVSGECPMLTNNVSIN